ncbi:MAG: hypothetical protein WC208_03115 [Gallionella sp.]|jgi:hypothetical protein
MAAVKDYFSKSSGMSRGLSCDISSAKNKVVSVVHIMSVTSLVEVTGFSRASAVLHSKYCRGVLVCATIAHAHITQDYGPLLNAWMHRPKK